MRPVENFMLIAIFIMVLLLLMNATGTITLN